MASKMQKNYIDMKKKELETNNQHQLKTNIIRPVNYSTGMRI